MASPPPVDLISAKMDELKQHLRIVNTEFIQATESLDRVTAEDINAFRDSPSMDVSAMDGYAVRWMDIDGNALPVCGTATAGSAPQQLALRSAMRVFTGGPVPIQAECVVRREDCQESDAEVNILVPKDAVTLGQNIRRQGENAHVGETVVQRGSLLTTCQFTGAMTFFLKSSIEVFKKVRIGIVNTGDELMEYGQRIEPWQIRDSNGPFLESSLAVQRWLQTSRSKVSDKRKQIEKAIREGLDQCDALLLTGGVSMGNTDYVPDSIRSSGGQVVFHRIPIRPGGPMLGAYGPQGQLILGLPGNPLSVAVTFRRYAMEMIRHMAGFSIPEPIPRVSLDVGDTKTIDLTWFRLVSLKDDGKLALVPSQGSGDIASLVLSSGFIEISPNCQSAGTRKYYAW